MLVPTAVDQAAQQDPALQADPARQIQTETFWGLCACSLRVPQLPFSTLLG